MTENITPVKRALLSVSDKDGLIEFATRLVAAGVDLLSTGGTARSLREAGLPVVDVSSVTGFPEIMDGRVKTLHPAIHGGLLARRDKAEHLAALEAHDIGLIDMLVVNLYPFAATIASGADWDTAIENIDIGGPAMTRAAAKNHDFLTVVTDPSDYADIASSIESEGGTNLSQRRNLALKAFSHTAAYDGMISQWLERSLSDDNDNNTAELPQTLSINAPHIATLRYGENSHQSAATFSDGTSGPSVLTARQLQGKALSYNNINDTDAAFRLAAEFSAPTIAIIKHANPCGVASRSTLKAAWTEALSADPISAFGGIIAMNQTLDAETAAEISSIFTEVIIAPSVTDDAAAILAKKPNLRVLETAGMPDAAMRRLVVKSVLGGYLLQTADNGILQSSDLKVVTKQKPTEAQMQDLMFAWRVAKHVKSNAIIYARDEAIAAIGAGQMSRLDSSRIAAQKAKDMAEHHGWAEPRTIGSAVASDAFFPFADGMLAAAEAGATSVIQPGGSMRDDEVIAAADEAGLAMVFTGMRHFNH